MPTGYTHDVQEGKVTEFRDFALQCARAFGALILMRDDPSDTPIPDEFKPSTEYHDRALAAARATLAEVPKLSSEACDERALAEYAQAVASWHDRNAERSRHRERYEAMLAKVRAWTPPSSDHRGLKEFMESQLVQSIDFDCTSRTPFPTRLTGSEWRRVQIEAAQRDVTYHTEKRAEEIERTNDRNRWVKQLRDALR